jgi:hypothetical protein
MLNKLRYFLWLARVALDLDFAKTLRRISRVPEFKRQMDYFRSQSDWPLDIEPKLGDFNENAGSLGEYFWQDLYVAKKVLDLNPKRHIDVGSRIDGFVAHLACVRKMEVLDIRPLPFQIPNIIFHQIDILNLPESFFESADCVTCLHTIEHFGLGRYGDQIDPDAWKKGFENISKLVKNKGKLIISTPIGFQRVKFNAHRVFHPATIAQHGQILGLNLESFAWLKPNGNGVWNESKNYEQEFCITGNQKYSLGIFFFEKF